MSGTDRFEAVSLGEWVEEALCAQVSGDFWFPDKGGSPWEAQSICARCPVREACAQYALDDHSLEGVFGGLTREDRKAIWRESKVEVTEDLEETA